MNSSLDTLDVMKEGHTSAEVLKAYGKTYSLYVIPAFGALTMLLPGVTGADLDLRSISMNLLGIAMITWGGVMIHENSADAYYCAMLDYAQHGKFTKLEKKVIP